MAMPNDTTTEWLDDAGQELREATEAGGERMLELAKALPFAALGAVEFGWERGRVAAENGRALPGKLAANLRSIPQQVASAFEDRVERGRRVVDRVRGRAATRDALHQFDYAGRKVRGAATSAQRAARRATRAAEEAADAALNPQDNRAYEDRTLAELYELASEREVQGRSSMNKRQLIAALRSQR